MGACSFVVGSDGYLYQGRGWHWVGAHTKGYNSKGYGVSYVGDFSATLPDPDAIALVRDGLLPCAVRTGRLHRNYTLRGHRQMGRTDCPGNSLFREIETWHGFEVEHQALWRLQGLEVWCPVWRGVVVVWGGSGLVRHGREDGGLVRVGVGGDAGTDGGFFSPLQ